MDFYLYLVLGLAVVWILFRRCPLFAGLIFFTILSFIMGFREYSVGTDTLGYVDRFDYYQIKLINCIWYPAAILSDGYEIGYMILYRVVGVFTDNSHILLVANAVIFLLCVFCGCWKNSILPLFSIFLFVLIYFLPSMNIMRQFVATGILLAGIHLLKKKKKWQYALIILLASSIHAMTIAFFVVYVFFVPSLQRLYSRKSFFYTMMLATLIISQVGDLPQYFANMSQLDAMVGERASSYMVRTWIENRASTSIILQTIYFGYILYLMRDTNGIISKIVFLGVCIANIAGGFGDQTYRFSYIFMIFQILLLPNVFKELSGLKKWMMGGSAILYSFVQYYVVISTNASDVIPYVNCLIK